MLGENSIGSSGLGGRLTWRVCQQLPVGIFFFSVPLDGTMLHFSAFVFARGPDGLAGEAGGLLELGPTKEVPFPKYKDRAQDATSSGVEEPLMMGWGFSADMTAGSGSLPYQGGHHSYLWLKVSPNNRDGGREVALPRGWRRVDGWGRSLMTGHIA